MANMNEAAQHPYQLGRQLVLETEDTSYDLEIVSIFANLPTTFTLSCVMEVTSPFDNSTMVLKIFDHTQATAVRKTAGCPQITPHREKVLSKMLCSEKYSSFEEWLLKPVPDGFVKNSWACQSYLEQETWMTEEELSAWMSTNLHALQLVSTNEYLLSCILEELGSLFNLEEVGEGSAYFRMQRIFRHELEMFKLIPLVLQGQLPRLVAVGKLRAGEMVHNAILMEKTEGVPLSALPSQSGTRLVSALSERTCSEALVQDTITWIHLFWLVGLQYLDFSSSNLLLQMDYSGRVRPMFVDLGSVQKLRTHHSCGAYTYESLEDRLFTFFVKELPLVQQNPINLNRLIRVRFPRMSTSFDTLARRLITQDIFQAWTPYDGFDMAAMNLRALQCARDVLNSEVLWVEQDVWIDRGTVLLALIFAPTGQSPRQLQHIVERALKNLRRCIADFVPDLLENSKALAVSEWKRVSEASTLHSDDCTQLENTLAALCRRYESHASRDLQIDFSEEPITACLRDKRIFQQMFWHEELLSVAQMEKQLQQRMKQWAHMTTRSRK